MPYNGFERSLVGVLRKVWIEVRSSLWFLPGLLVLGGAALALILVQIDIAYAEQLTTQRWEPLLNAGAEGARGMLTAIASSMITVAGVAFSVTIVTLSLASTQYTPRILRNFMRDRANQFVLGIFVAIFTYCLVVLRTIRGGGEENGGGFVPLVAVAFAVALALLAIGSLIFFIHHVATSIQASTILKSITRETCAAIDSIFPDDLGEEEDPTEAEPELEGVQWHPVAARSSGYLQHIDSAALLRFAKEHEVILRIERSPGEFCAEGAPLISVDRELEKEKRDSLRALLVIGDFRTVEQDAGFGIRQIVDIAMKALSPGVNDTSTAVSCLDYLSAILRRLALRRIASPFREKEGELRVIAAPRRFAEHVAKSFDEIRLSAKGNVTILLQMLCAIQRVAGATRSASRRQTLLKHATHVAELADRSVPSAYDRERINEELENTRQALDVTADRLPAITRERTKTG